METKDSVQSEQTNSIQADAEKTQTKTETTEEIVVTKSAEELAKRLKEVSQEAKQYRQRLAEEKKLKEDLQRKSLEDQGQFKELADIYKAKAETAEMQSKKLRDAFAMKSVADSVAIEAGKLGCVDADALIQLLPLDQIPIGDGFNVDREHVRTVLEEFKKGKPYLFQKQSPRIPDGTPGKTPAVTGKPVEKMTAQELEARIIELHKKG
jgi:hypothetical protein